MAGTVNDVAVDEGGAREARRVPFLVVGLECDRPLAGGARFSLERVVEVCIGRGAERGAQRSQGRAGIALDLRLPASAMSTSHARLTRAGGEWVLEDLASTNGTFLNGTRIERAVVGAGDVLTLGRTLLLISAPLLTESDEPGDIDVATLPPQSGHITLDPELAAALRNVARVAASALSVLVRGETGTGKEVLARSIHAGSGRAGHFVAVNCAGIPAPLVESHFFGHVKGAFSGAVSNEPGLFRAADGGTLFLDEVGDLPLPSQAALLRALQEREILPVGSTRPIKVDLRVLAATHAPLEEMVVAGTFRADLLARLAGSTVELPPLRARRFDLGVILATLLRRLAPAEGARVRFAPAAGEALFRYDWPNNTRELEQCLSRALILAGPRAVELQDLPSAVQTEAGTANASPSGLRARDEKIRRELLDQLARHRGNLADVGRAMGKARMQVHRWCKRFGIDPNLYRS